LDSDTAWLLGIYAAEGCPASNGSRFSLNAKELDLQNRIQGIAERLGYSVSKTTRNNCTSCCLSSNVLSGAFAEWCGVRAANKKMPEFVLLNKDESILRSFLEGWEAGDGYFKKGMFVGSSVSKTLALQLQLAYVSLGVNASVSHIKKTKANFYGKIINQHDVYVVKYYKSPNKIYSRRFGNYILHPIRKIETVQYKGEVCNIETSNNTYIVSNAVVHNCNIWTMKPKDELRIEEIREFAAKNNYFKWIELTGGEPFLRSDIVDIAKAFSENSKQLYLLTMPTNSLCNPDTELARIREILSLGVPRVVITISLDGYRELHDKIRGIPGNFDRAMAMAKRLTELKKEHRNLNFLFGYTMSRFNEGEFAKTFEAVKAEIPSVTYNDFHVNLSQLSNNYYHNDDLQIKVQNEIAIRELKEIIANRHFDIDPMQLVQRAFMKGLVKFASTGKAPIKCRSLEASLFMDSWGNIYPSIMWDKKIANIREIGYDLGKIWNSDDAKQIRQMVAEGKDPQQWTSCEAYQALTGKITSLL
jgi:MoaA/NifB/PqqE/SkfB family radical SAM enzyme